MRFVSVLAVILALLTAPRDMSHSSNQANSVHPAFREGEMAEYRRKFLRLSAWVYLFSLALIWMVSHRLPGEEIFWPVVYAVIATGLLAASALLFFPWHRFHPNWLLIIVAPAIIQISALTIATGGEESPFFLLHLFVIILSSAYFTGPALIASILMVIFGSSAYHLFEHPVRFDWVDHLFSFQVYGVAALITNLLFRDLRRLSAQAQRHLKQLDAVYQAARLLHAESTTSALLFKLLEVARETIGARYAAIRTFDASGREVLFHHAGLTDAERVLLQDPPRDIGVLGLITAESGPLRLEDLTQHPHHIGFPPGHPPMKRFLGVPISLQGRLLGKLYLTEKTGGAPFTKQDEALVTTLANDAAIALEKAMLLDRIKMMAVTDELTELYNRRAFDERCAQEVQRAARYRHICSLIIADIDNFKKVNDTHGHSVGDAALKAVAATLRGLIRNVDFIARYGGEEFAVLLPESGKKGATMVAERLRAGVEGLSFHLPQGGALPLTISIGVASYPDDADAPEKLVQAADAALYKAKRRGKNHVVAEDGGGHAENFCP